MNICMVGIDHSQATLDVRAVFSFTKMNMQKAMDDIAGIKGIGGCVMISTCNRMELWASVDADWDGSLYEILCQLKGVDLEEYRIYFRERRGESAVNHLFHLACGLKSQILGEDQIITQVGEALAFARENGAADSVLEVLFRKAVTAGKRVKTQVVFPRGNASVIANAISRLEKQKIPIKGKQCMVIGNGEMGKIAASAFAEAGAHVLVTVRHYHHKTVEIPEGCYGVEYSYREEYMPGCDFIVSATTSPHLTVTKEMIIKALNQEDALSSKKILIDLAVPRDIQKETEELEEVTLYDMDDFKSPEKEEALQTSMEQAEVILQEQIQEFYEWLGGYRIMPRIQFIKEEAVNDLNLRIHKFVRNIPLEEKEKEKLLTAINNATEKVVNKMIFKLKDDLEEEAFTNCIKSLEQLYEE